LELSVFCNDLVNVVNSETAVNVLIDCENRCKTAGTDAAAGLERELTVSSTFAAGDAELFLELVIDIA
jgi:hypothetical protein